MRTSESIMSIKRMKPRLINTELLKDVEKQWRDNKRKSRGKLKSKLVCYNTGLFVGGRLRGSIFFQIDFQSYRAIIMPMAGFVHVNGLTENELVSQIMEWIMREYIGATDIEVRSENKSAVCKKLNKELRAFSTENQRNKVAPAGRTRSRDYMPTDEGEKRYARVS